MFRLIKKMLDNVHISLYSGDNFSHPFDFFVVPKGILQLGSKFFSKEQLPIDPYMLLCKQKNLT